MHTIHTTPGFIVGSRPNGEAGKLISVFTQDLGLIRASAQGIRLEKSKLRPFIQDYSLGVFSFVRGKEVWRLTNAQEMGNEVMMDESKDRKNTITQSHNYTIEKSGLVARVALLLNRLLQGEESHPELFKTVQSFFDFLDSSSDLDTETFKTLESLTVIRLLHRLGYVANIAKLNEQIDSNDLNRELLVSLKSERNLINKHINTALRESHL